MQIKLFFDNLLNERLVRRRIGIDTERHRALLAHAGQPPVHEILKKFRKMFRYNSILYNFKNNLFV
jgi:hypothetical protein